MLFEYLEEVDDEETVYGLSAKLVVSYFLLGTRPAR